MRAGPPYRFAFSKAERIVMRRQKWLPPSQWAERYRMVRMSSLPGLWQNVFTPYLVGVMDAGPLPGRGGGHPMQDAADGRLGGPRSTCSPR